MFRKTPEEKKCRERFCSISSLKIKNRYFCTEKKAGRHDLIGYGKNCLVTPENGRNETRAVNGRKNRERQKIMASGKRKKVRKTDYLPKLFGGGHNNCCRCFCG